MNKTVFLKIMQKCSAASFLTAIVIAILTTNSYAASEEVSLDALQTRFSQGDYNFVIETLNQDRHKTTEEYHLLISALMNEDLDEAEQAAEDFITQYYDDYRAHHMHASVMGAQASNSIFSALGYAEKAKESLEKAVAIAPEKVEVYQALMQFHLAAPSIAGGDKDEASRLVDKISTLDTVEGHFAKAHFLMAQDEAGQAIAIFKDLQKQSESKVRAIFELGSFYLYEEKYDQAFEILQPLMTLNLPSREKLSSPEWDTYEREMYNLLYGKYRIGLAALQSDSNTKSGIKALQQYLHELKNTPINTTELPHSDWAHLRLAELLMRDNQISEAETALASLQHIKDERFNKILKELKKKIKKRT